MANMLIDERRRYPNLWGWVSTELPRSFAEPGILAAFTAHSGLPEPRARLAVERSDTPPWIHVRQLEPTGSNPVDARFRSTEPGRIMLAVEAAQAFERMPTDPRATRFVQAKVLHELVHWALFHSGIGEAGESGVAFESQAYGGVVPRFWTEAPVRRYVFPVDGAVGSGLSYWGRSIRENNTRNHNGIDVHAERGQPVYAIAAGTVVTSDRRYRRGGEYLTQTGNYGQMVDIDHGNGLVSRYAHLETVEVGPGAVAQGTRIGTVGASGTELGAWLYGGQHGPEPRTTRPHLHFEILKAGGTPFRDIDSTLDPSTIFPWLGAGAAARGVATAALRAGEPIAPPSGDAPTLPTVPSTSRGGDGRAYPADVPVGAPRGLRNNNPGNLKTSAANLAEPWLGQIPAAQATDDKFLQFTEMKFGIRAMARCLRSYQTQHGIRTIAAMSSRWAPSVDNNDPGTYARNVLGGCRGVAAGVNAPIDFTDAQVAFGIVCGIIVAENGEWAHLVSDDVVQQGIALERA